MEVQQNIITPDNYNTLLKIFISKRSEFERFEFCELIGISQTNTITYNKIIGLLKYYNIVKECASIKNAYYNAKRILIDRKKLERFILQSEYYKLNDTFIHTCMFGCITP